MSIHRLGATELHERLERKEISSVEIVKALFARIDSVNGRLNAIVHGFREEALSEAEEADDARRRGRSRGPLHGLPVTIKESINTAGVATTLGVKSQAHQPAAEDAVVVKLLRRAGAIIIGKTNISQTLLFNEADNPIFGRTSNPFDPARTSGGSSGGEAAALGAGMTPLGIGTDIGGSIRVPASYCGVAGLKPTVDRWSMLGCRPAIPGQEVIRAQCGPIARTAKDVALLFRALDGPSFHDLDPNVPPIDPPDPSGIDLSNLVVGYYEDDGFLTPSTAVRRGVREAAAALAKAGARVIEHQPAFGIELTYLYFAALSSDGGRTLEKLLAGDAVVSQLVPLKTLAKLPRAAKLVLAAYVGSQGEARLERLLRTVGEKSVSDLWGLVAERNRLRLATLSQWDDLGIDVMLSPPHATPALLHGQSRDFSIAASYSMAYNTLNFPAGVVPVTRVRPEEAVRPSPRDRVERVAAQVDIGSAGLPIGVQIAARPYREDLVLAAMMAVERQLAASPNFPSTPVEP